MSQPQPPADLVLTGGTVRTLDPDDTVATALAVRNGRIAAVGTDARVAPLIGPATRVINLSGACALPGINDAHLHGAWLGALWPATLFGGPVPSPEASDAADVTTGVGHPENPLPDEGGDLGADAAGEHGGTQRLVESGEQLRAAILRAQRVAASLGITSYTEPGLGPGEDHGPTGVFGTETLAAYRELADAGLLTSRVSALALFGLLDGASTLEDLEAGLAHLPDLTGVPVGPRAAAPEEFWRVLGVKIFADGIPPARNAWIHGCYPEGGSGSLLVEGADDAARAAALAAMVVAAHRAGLQVGLHATGDRTIDELVAVFAGLNDDAAVAAARHYLIHGDLISRAAVQAIGELGIGFNTQPAISETTADWLAGAVGPEAAARAWPLREVLDAGASLTLTSDAPVVAPDWRISLAAADRLMGPTANAAARVTTLLHTVTTAGAWQDHAEHVKGTLQVGMLADIAVLSAVPVAVGASALPGLEVLYTVTGGRVVHSPEAPAVP